MAAVAGVLFLVVLTTRRTRGRGWAWAFGLFALALALDAAASHFGAREAAMISLGTLACIGAAYFSSSTAFEITESPMPIWARALIGGFGLFGLFFVPHGGLTRGLLAQEMALFPAVPTIVVAILPAMWRTRRLGLITVFAVCAVLGVVVARTLISSAVLAYFRQELNALYWTVEIFAGVILAFVLAMGELIVLLETFRADLEKSNVALNKALDRLELAAKLDPLTALYNRNALYELVENLSSGGKSRGSIAIFDLNNLKKINDTYGHHAGDLAILSVARRLRQFARSTDVLVRWGGDEFVLVLVGTSPEVARKRFVRMEAPEPVTGLEHPPIHLSVSWGVARLSENVDASLRQADSKLYEQRRVLREAAKESVAQ